MPAIFYFCYSVGAWLINAPVHDFKFEANWQWIADSLSSIGPAFLLGCGVLAIIFSVLGYFGMQLLWRYSAVKAWKET